MSIDASEDHLLFWGKVADFYGKNPKPETIEMYAIDTSDTSIEELVAAFGQYRRDPENKFMPLPNQLMGFINPKPDACGEAREAAARIVGAVRDIGMYDSEGARAYIGELGWRVVQLNGGWFSVASTMCDRDIPSLTAQFRELAAYQHQKAVDGRLDIPPGLPEHRTDFIAPGQGQEKQKQIVAIVKNLTK